MKVRVHKGPSLLRRWFLNDGTGALRALSIAEGGGVVEVVLSGRYSAVGALAAWGREKDSDKWWVNKDGDWAVYYVQTEDEAIALATTLARMANE